MRVSRETLRKLKELKRGDDTYDDVINRLLIQTKEEEMS
ncbi:MAG: DUF7557 family protein [Candidatus Hodarchaeales archaeon]